MFAGPAPYRGYHDNKEEFLPPPPPPTSSYMDHNFPPPPPDTKENIYHEIHVREIEQIGKQTTTHFCNDKISLFVAYEVMWLKVINI